MFLTGRPHFCCLLLLALLGALALPSFAVSRSPYRGVVPSTSLPKSAPAPASAPVAPDYRLGPDDVISVVVARHPELSLESETIPSSGKITIPQIGEVYIAGKTLSQAQYLLTKALGRLLKRPEASIVLKTQRPRRVLVLGTAVATAGALNANIGWHVLDALAAAGGLKAGLSPELVSVMLTRANGNQLSLNLPGMLADRSLDPIIQPGDRIVFSPRTLSVTIAGQVVKPGVYDISLGGGLSELIAQAGGPASSAALTQVSIKHSDGTVTMVDLRTNPTADPELKVGDLVVVPELRSHVTLSGAVIKAGVYDLEDGRATHVADLIALAGGLTAPADQVQITLTRSMIVPSAAGDGNETNTVRRPVTRDQLVQDGDMIEVTATHVNVTVAGEIKAAGVFDLRPSDGLPELLAKAGGATENAALTHVTVKHGGQNGEIVTVDAYDALHDGKPLDFTLQDGDYVFVPQNKARIYVTGAVGKFGYQTVPERVPFTLGEALTEAGGPAQNAKTKEVGLIRQTPQGEKRTVLDLNQTYNGRLALNMPLQHGDVIYVPPGTAKRSVLERALQILPIAGLFAF